MKKHHEVISLDYVFNWRHPVFCLQGRDKIFIGTEVHKGVFGCERQYLFFSWLLSLIYFRKCSLCFDYLMVNESIICTISDCLQQV